MTAPAPDTYTTDLVAGVADELARAGVGLWHPDGAPYPVDSTGITDSAMPDSPNRIVCLTAYALTNDPDLNDALTGLQVRCRGANADPRDANNLADRVFGVLQGLRNRTYGTAYVVSLARQSSAPLGQDTSRRWERSDNYHATAAHLGAGDE